MLQMRRTAALSPSKTLVCLAAFHTKRGRLTFATVAKPAKSTIESGGSMLWVCVSTLVANFVRTELAGDERLERDSKYYV